MSVLFVDVETIGNNPRSPECELLMTGWRYQGVTTMDVGQPSKVLQDLLLDPAVPKCSHTLYDCGWLDWAGDWYDTRVMAWVVNENTPLDLDWLAKKYADVTMDKRLRQVANRVVFKDDLGLDHELAAYHEWPPEVQEMFKRYCIRDVDTLAALYKHLGYALEATEQFDYWLEEEVPFTTLCAEMERNGLPVNLDETLVLATQLRAELEKSEASLRRLSRVPVAFNLGSPDQLAEYLFKRWFQVKDRLPISPETRTRLRAARKAGEKLTGIPKGFEVTSIGTRYLNGHWVVRGRGLKATPPTKRKLPNGDVVEGKHPSTATPDLMYQHANDPWVRELCLTHRRLGRLLTSYLEKFPKVAVDGRIHGRYNQGGTVTGRLSSSDPNLQNIPSKHEWGDAVRALFQGHFIIGDYDALEMRIMAHLSGDKELIRIFRENLDPHERTAVAIFGACDGHDDPRRGQGKTINYAVGYGAGPRKLAQVLSLEGYKTTQSEAREYLDLVQGFYKGWFRYAERSKWHAKDHGYVMTLAGRRRKLKGAFEEAASWKSMMYGERQAVNSEVQGGAADVIRTGMLAVRKALPHLRTLAQIHDEAIWEPRGIVTTDELLVIQTCMEAPYNLRVPLIFEPFVCESWAQKGEGSAIELLEEEARKT